MLRVALAVILSAGLISVSQKNDTPVNNLETKVVHTKLAGQSASKLTDKDVAEVEKPVAHVPESQPEVVAAETPAPQTPAYTGTHEELMAAAGISPEDYGAADYIISHESSWNPDATEPTTGAHGLPQALPYSKTGCGWEDAVCQLQWASQYASSRYEGWQGAYAHWISYRWW